MLFTSIRSATSYTTELDTEESNQLGGVAVYDISGCGVQVYQFKPHAGNNIFFTVIVCD